MAAHTQGTGGNGAGSRRAFVNARIVDPASGTDGPGGVLVEGPTILDAGLGLFADGMPEDAEIVDCEGLVLAPGLVDGRVFVCEPGAEHRETYASAGAAAAAGGVTTIISMPNTAPVIDDVALVEYVTRHGRDSAGIDVRCMASITKGLGGREMTEMGLLAEAGAVAFTEGDRTLSDARVMRRALSYASAFDLLIVQHAEEPSLSSEGCMNEGGTATRLGLAGIPKVAETIIIERDIRLVELTGGRYHVAEVSCPESVEIVSRAKDRGLDVTCGISPHLFALNEQAVGDYRTFAKTSPPLRDETDRAGIVAALANGEIDIISSSHNPQDVESKRRTFAQAAAGVVGLETMLPVTLELYHNGHLSILDALAAMTIRPALLFGLSCGRLAPGAPADLVLIDLARPWQVDADRLLSKSKNTAFDGRPVQGRAIRTVAAGRDVFDYKAERPRPFEDTAP